MSKKRKGEATAEEQEIMRRAEAKAAGIGTKPSTGGYTFDEEAEKQRVMESKKPGVTVVEGVESGMPGQQRRESFAEQKTTSFSPTQVANSEILKKVLNDDNANIASNAILAEGTKSAESLEELEQVKADADVARDLEEIEKNKLQTEIYSGPGASSENLIPNASSAYLQGIGEGQGKPSYLGGVATKDQIEKNVVDSYANMDNQIPQAVVEKLGVQDYYPQAGRDVAVGNFTGSRIGSQTIYSGAGALLPMGLYDARKRALAKAATEKQAAVDKYFDVIDTAPQYQEPFNVSTIDWMNDNLYNKHKGNADEFLKDPAVRREYARRQGLAKELKHYSTWADALLKDAADDKKYVTPEMINISGEIKSALVNNAEDVVSGKKDLGPLFAKAQVYQNIVPQIDIMVKQAYSASALGESPINLRTGGEYDKESFKKEAADFVREVKSGNINRDAFITGYKKFFTGDYEQAIKALTASGKYAKEQEQAGLDYFAGQMQEQVKFDTKILDSKEIDWATLAQRKREWQADYDRRIQEGKTHWQSRREEMNFVDRASGKPMAQVIQDFKNKGLKGDKLNQAILNVARRNGVENATIDPYTNSLVVKEQASTYENSKPRGVNNNQLWVNVKEKVIKNGKPDFKFFAIKAQDLQYIDLSKRKLAFEDDTHITKEFQKNLKKSMSKNKITMRTNGYELGYGYADPNKNDIITVNGSNIDKYDPSKMVLVKKNKGTLSATILNDDGKEVNIPLPGNFFVKGEFTSDASVNAHDENWGQGIKSEPGFGLGQGTVVETGTYSSSSGSGEE
jgi:hypothetical protein